MVRILSQSFPSFKVKKDSVFESVFGQAIQTQNKFKMSEPEKVVHESLKGVKFLSYNFLFQALHALDMLLNSLQVRQ